MMLITIIAGMLDAAFSAPAGAFSMPMLSPGDADFALMP